MEEDAALLCYDFRKKLGNKVVVSEIGNLAFLLTFCKREREKKDRRILFGA